MSSGTKYVYFFGGGKSEGDASMRNLLGGKGANLAEMNNIGLPVPAGFTITTEVCTYFYDNDRTYPPELVSQVEAALKQVEETMGAEFGSQENPLLLSCRSGARESMPGMMDTVLNIGLNDETVEVLVWQSPVCLGQLPSLYPDVRRRGHGCASGNQGRGRRIRTDFGACP